MKQIKKFLTCHWGGLLFIIVFLFASFFNPWNSPHLTIFWFYLNIAFLIAMYVRLFFLKKRFFKDWMYVLLFAVMALSYILYIIPNPLLDFQRFYFWDMTQIVLRWVFVFFVAIQFWKSGTQRKKKKTPPEEAHDEDE